MKSFNKKNNFKPEKGLMSIAIMFVGGNRH